MLSRAFHVHGHSLRSIALASSASSLGRSSASRLCLNSLPIPFLSLSSSSSSSPRQHLQFQSFSSPSSASSSSSSFSSTTSVAHPARFLRSYGIPSSSIGLPSLSGSFSSAPTMGPPSFSAKASFTTGSSSGSGREILVQHLLVKENDLKLLIELQKRIAQGEDLSDLAAEYSIYPSKEEGGMLGWVKRGQMVPEFEEAAFSAPVNTVVRCKTKFGWHLLEVLSERDELLLQEIQAKELHEKLQDPVFVEQAQLIDVREPHEVCAVISSTHFLDAGVLMEDRLDNSSCEVRSKVVCNVLKRCFKVPHLARRFFNWVKLNHGDCLTTESYNIMLYLAGEMKEFEMVERLVEEMENGECEKDIKTWTILLLHYGKAKLVGKSLLIFEKMRKLGFEPDAKAYGLMIRLLCESRKGEIALEFYKEMLRNDMVPGVKVYRLLLNCLADCGDIDGVYLVADNMIKVSEIPQHDVYSCVLRSFCISGRIREALELIRDIKNKDLTLSPVYFEILVKGLCKADKMDDALEIVDIMKKRNVVDEVVYGTLISSYLRKNDAPKALDLLHGMKEAGLTPLTSTYTKLMQHLFNVNEYDKGSALFDEMLEIGIKMDNVAYMAMIAGHVRHGNISDAWTLFRKMEEEGTRASQKSYSIFIKELCRASKTDEIINVLRKMHDSKVTVGKEISCCVVSYLARKKEFLKLEEVDEIRRHCKLYCQEVEASGKDHPKEEICTGDSNNAKPDVKSDYVDSNANCLLVEPLPRTSDEDLQTICTILSSSKDWSLMQEALEKHQVHYTADLVTEILRICSPCGSAVLHFFSWVKKQPGYRHTTDTYNMAIKIAGRGKDFEHMRSLFYEMQRNGCLVTSDTWTIMILSYGRVGLTDIALRNFSEMQACGCKPTASAYKYLILPLCGRKGGKVEEALKLFKEMMNMGLVPDKELVEGFFDCLCQAGKLAEARKCLEYLCQVGFTTLMSYSLLIRALCRRGKVEEALALTDDVKEDRSTLDHYVYGSLVHGLLKKGQIDEALAKLESMKIAGVHPTAHVYTSLISHFGKEKKMDQALHIFKKMWEESCHPTVVTYTALIHGYMNAGNVAEAQKLFLRMRLKGPFPDFKAYTVLIAGLCEVGKSEEALQVLYEMMDVGVVPSSINFRTVFFGLNREGKRHLAQIVMQQKRATASKRKLLHG